MEQAKNKIIEILEKESNIVIAGHVSPDADSIGSCLAFAQALDKLGKKPIVLLEDYNVKYNIIPGRQFIYKGDWNDIEPDVFLCLDFGATERLGGAKTAFDKAKLRLCIDHHVSRNAIGEYNYIDDKASSACQLVYGFITAMVEIDKDIAAALYAGIVTDTGGFKHRSTGPSTHIIAAKLMETGIDFSEIYNEVMRIRSIEEMNIFRAAMDKLVIDKDYPISHTNITIDDLDNSKATTKDLDGIVENCLNIRGVSVSFFIYEKPMGSVKVSLRSKKIDVASIAHKFNGGGHILAAGFDYEGSIQEATQKVLEMIKKEMDN